MEQGQTEIATLAEYRLERKWTLQQLSDAMAREGWGVPMRTLAKLLAEPQVTPRPLTLHAIRKYIAIEREAGRLPVQEAKSA